LIEAQTLFMGLATFLTAVPAGYLTALLLIDVINRRAFGWHIDLHVGVSQFANALWLALAAAAIAGIYPAWRAARAPIATEMREE
jgi:putative ABC transport system permease protein